MFESTWGAILVIFVLAYFGNFVLAVKQMAPKMKGVSGGPGAGMGFAFIAMPGALLLAGLQVLFVWIFASLGVSGPLGQFMAVICGTILGLIAIPPLQQKTLLL